MNKISDLGDELRTPPPKKNAILHEHFAIFKKSF